MNDVFITSLFQNAIKMILLIAGPILGIGMIVGLIIAILQATTSIQEQTLTFVPKIVATVLTLMFLGNWIMRTLVNFTRIVFEQIPYMVR